MHIMPWCPIDKCLLKASTDVLLRITLNDFKRDVLLAQVLGKAEPTQSCTNDPFVQHELGL
jgi:hypothetical protein